MNFEELQGLVLDWADDKDLLHEENAEKQFMKFIEEAFEFKTEMDMDMKFFELRLKIWQTDEEIKTEMGDILVTLIILCKQLDLDPNECLSMAYEKISKRKGKTINGVFVKAEDL
ncbi:MAG: MazG-like family protein [Peptoniphilus sp. oral taxon 375]|nr:MazG-like family protein [Peptoniphilus sp. oral taxon 375]